jgi:RHH-type rel operon transcriptional repressor/antitoxin RelB
MLSLRLPQDIEERLNTLSKATHRTKSYYVTCALKAFLDEYEDILLATSRWEKLQRGESKLISLEELETQQSLKKS